MSFSAASLSALLEERLPPGTVGLVVALSGGSDSACLLAALSAAPRRLPLRAVHVNHGLQAAAMEFVRRCSDLCGRLDVPLQVLDVRVDCTGGVSIEAAARDARYGALAANLAAGESLLTAHHAADQGETVLLQLVRGAGPKGLAAMPVCRVLGAGWHVRPLLDVARQDLQRYAREEAIEAVSDPMNGDERFDRVFLRESVLPLLKKRWPGIEATLARTAVHLAQAESLLLESATRQLTTVRDGEALSVTGLRSLSAAQRSNVVRQWIAANGASLPSAARLREALRQMLEARSDHLPVVPFGDWALRRYRDRLFLTSMQAPRLSGSSAWSIAAAEPLDLGSALGILRWSPRHGGLDPARLPATLTVRGREGGERLRPQARGRTQRVQHLCQSLGVLPWMRDALPFVYAGDALVAIGDLWVDARWCVDAGVPGLGVRWEGAPTLV